MSKPPNRSKYTPELHEQIVAYIRQGYPKTVAFRLVGLNADTGWDWLRAGRERPDDYPHYVQLAEDIDHAIAEVQAERVDQILAAAQDPKHWTAAAWYLERTDPQTWGRKDRVQLDAGDSGPLIQLNQLVLVDGDARQSSRELLRRATALGSVDADELRALPQPRPAPPSENE
jgi:hypothetical protein